MSAVRHSRIVLAGLLLAAGLACATAARAGDLLRLYGEENVGAAGGQFLRVPVGARAVALGKAYSALANDGSAPFWNPAGINHTPGRHNFFFSHSEYAAGIDLEHLAWHTRRQNFAFALSMGVLRSGDIERTDEFHQEGTGQYFNANQFFAGLTVSRAMTDRFSVGVTGKYYQENLDEYQLKSVLFDVGIMYFLGLGDTRVGFSARNFGGDLRPGGTPPTLSDGYVPGTEFQSFAAPTEGIFGAARTWELGREIGFLTTADFSHPSDAKESFRMGGELGLRRMLFLRAGYETSRVEGGFSAGFGLQLVRKQMNLRIDYAYSDMGAFGTIHYFSIDLSPLHKRRDPDAWRRRDR